MQWRTFGRRKLHAGRWSMGPTSARSPTSRAERPEIPSSPKKLRTKSRSRSPVPPAPGKNKTNSKNLIVNGTFDSADTQGHPAGWTLAENYKVMHDGTNAIVHASAEAPVYQSITQDVAVPARARNVTLRGRVRGKIIGRDAAKSQGPPGFFLSGVYIHKNDKPTANWIMIDGGGDARWKTVTQTNRIPEGMKTLRVALVLKYVSGEFDYDDIEVEFR